MMMVSMANFYYFRTLPSFYASLAVCNAVYDPLYRLLSFILLYLSQGTLIRQSFTMLLPPTA